MKNILLPFCLSLFALSLQAQVDKHGCYVTRQGKEKPKALTAIQRAAINSSIARSDTFDILDYEITLDAKDFAGQRIEANTVVTLTPKMSGQLFVRFDLFQLTVDSVFVNGTGTTWNYDSEILQVFFPSAVPPSIGDTLKVQVYYQGQPHRDPDWGGFYFASGIVYNLGIGLTSIPPNFGKVWYPCFDSFVERATYTYHITTGQGRKAWCQGDFLGETVLQGDTVMRSWRMDDPIPPHASAIAAANYSISDSIYQGAYAPLTVRLQALPGELALMESRMADVYGTIDALEFWYGPSPYDRVGYTQTTQGALEIPECIAFPTFMTSQSQQSNRELLAHELGHYWWGDYVTPYNHNDMWLKEGPAEYSQHLAEEWISGRDAFLEMIKDNLLFILEDAHVDDNGYQAMSPMPDPEIYGTHTYYKGAAMMHNMRGYLGDTLFRQAMMDMQQLMGNQTITPEQLRDSISVITGYDLTDFFADWIFQPGYAVFTVDDFSATASGAQWDVNVDLRQLLNNANTFHNNTPVDLTVVDADGNRSRHSVMASGQLSSHMIQSSVEPKFIIVNEQQRIHMSKLDHEFEFAPGDFVPSIQPYVDMSFFINNIADSTLVRLEHIHAGPSADQYGFGIDQISDAHYWDLNGNWPAGSDFKGRFQYDGGNTTDKDYNLLQGFAEDDIRLLYRANAQEPWELEPNASFIYGNMSDRVGFVNVEPLRIGHYAFGVGNGIVSVEEQQSEDPFSLKLFPVPANEVLNVRADIDGQALVYFRVFDALGKMVLIDYEHLSGQFTYPLQINDLPAGNYTIDVNAEGIELGKRLFIIEK